MTPHDAVEFERGFYSCTFQTCEKSACAPALFASLYRTNGVGVHYYLLPIVHIYRQLLAISVKVPRVPI